MKRTDPEHSGHNCKALFEKLSEYIDRELDPPTCEEIEAHIERCPPCQTCLKTLQQTVEICKHLKHRQVPKALSLKLTAAISELLDKQTS